MGKNKGEVVIYEIFSVVGGGKSFLRQELGPCWLPSVEEELFAAQGKHFRNCRAMKVPNGMEIRACLYFSDYKKEP